ncbi:carbohydrate ABC transporter permease [Pseudactinotalea sp. Z1748]|uniref:carbohydrate ABC transporter permease n=1 Tax=Pseudactinotalea sp. Z1748 TaxID=3413027 RepID=UPI003C7C8EE3
MSASAQPENQADEDWTTMGPRQSPRTWTSTRKDKVTATDALRVVILVTFVLLALIPVVWTVLGSFKTPSELAQRPITILPENWGLANYVDALGRFNFTVYLRNSVIVTVGATVLTLAINAMAAYALAKYNFRGRTALFLLTLATIMIPLQVILIPVYQVVASLGMVNTLWGLIIPAAATPTGVFILRQYMLGIPDELIEAARVDGSGEFRTFLRIVLPLCRPALAVVAILSVMWRWNDFLWPLVVAQSESVYTLPVALARFNAEETVPFNLILAMSVVTILPVIILFLFFQRQITTGIANTGIK